MYTTLVHVHTSNVFLAQVYKLVKGRRAHVHIVHTQMQMYLQYSTQYYTSTGPRPRPARPPALASRPAKSYCTADYRVYPRESRKWSMNIMSHD